MGDINGCYIYSSNALVVFWEPHLRAVDWVLGLWDLPCWHCLDRNIINIQTHMCSKYKYKCIQNTNIIVSYMQIQINLRSVDWVVGLWDLTCWHCRDKKAMGVSECTKIQIHDIVNTVLVSIGNMGENANALQIWFRYDNKKVCTEPPCSLGMH